MRTSLIRKLSPRYLILVIEKSQSPRLKKDAIHKRRIAPTVEVVKLPIILVV